MTYRRLVFSVCHNSDYFLVDRNTFSCWTSPQTHSLCCNGIEIEINETDSFRLRVTSHETLQQSMLNTNRVVFTVCLPPTVLFSAHFYMIALCHSGMTHAKKIWQCLAAQCGNSIASAVLYSTEQLALNQYHLFSALKDQLGGSNVRVVMRCSGCDSGCSCWMQSWTNR
jgi:hypothetical protein